jgi:shikimate kinase
VAERLLLVGMMGAGKSTVARLAAARLGWTWLDTDTLVTEAEGASVADLFARHGEAHFRAAEARALADALARPESLVVSVGGGAVVADQNRARLRAAGTVVWLRARPETLARRVGPATARPLLAGAGPEERAETLRRLDDLRRPLYSDVSDDVLDVDDLDATTVTERLLDLVGPGAPGRGVKQ